jgi:hypothetical protein
MHPTKRSLPILILIALFSVDASAYRDRGSWKKTLQDKAEFFEWHTAARHNIEGTYPSSVRLRPPNHYTPSGNTAWEQIMETGELPEGWTFDHGTTGVSNVAHTSSWTGCLLTAEAFHVAFLRDSVGIDHPDYKKAYERANEIVSGIRKLTLVSGQPGFLSRGFAYGHGISYEERGMTDTRDLWKQGVGELSYLRYRGGPSHHNYDQVFRGLGIYYFVAADEAQKEAILEIVADMSNWAHLRKDMRVMHDDGERESTVLIGGWRGMEGTDEPSGGSLMATTGLKVAAAITGNKKTADLYEYWVDHLGYRDPERTKESIMGPPRDNYDDTDHLLGDLYLLNIIEKDPDLKKFYTKCVKDSWEAHKDERMSWYNYVYWAVLGEEYGDPEGSLWNLQTFPTCRIFQPQMNSIRTDIEFVTEDGEKQAKDPLPVYERPSDNEYEWKGSPYALDRWQARIVSVVEVSPHDPFVQFAADTSGDSYKSLTQGEVWHGMGGLPKVHDFLFSPDFPWIAFAATNGGVYRSLNQGESWSQTLAQPAERLMFDPENSHVLYAVGSGGVFKSQEMSERNMGTVWKTLSEPALPSGAVYACEPGDPAKLYALTREGVYRKTEGDSEWTAPEPIVRTRGFSDVDPVGGTPLWLRADETKPGRLFRCVESEFRRDRMPFIGVSEDGGKTWQPVLKELIPLSKWASGEGDTIRVTREELIGFRKTLQTYRLSDLRVDRENPDRWYGLAQSGLATTEDAGKTWKISGEGLDIPLTQAFWSPRHSADLFVGTPAGLYVSRDRGETWKDTSLIPQGEGAIRSEIGGIGYLTAYWLGRYHGFIEEVEAKREWWK